MNIKLSKGLSSPRFIKQFHKAMHIAISLSVQFSSIQFNCSVVSDCLWPHGLQHASLPCPLPTPGVYSNLCPLSPWCHPTISSSVIPSPPAFNLSQHQVFSNDPVDVGNLISGSSAFSTTSLKIRKFTVHVLLKPGLENFEHYFTSMWDECNCAAVWAFFGIAFLWD